MVIERGAAVWARDWSGFFLFLLIGVLYAVAGFFTLQQPILAAESLTLMLAAAFVVGGVIRIIVALVERFPSWGWVLANGILTVLLGIAIWLQWPSSGLWVIGMFVGIDLIVNGTTWLMLAKMLCLMRPRMTSLGVVCNNSARSFTTIWGGIEIGPVGFSFTTGTRRSGCLRTGAPGARLPVRVPYPPGRYVPGEVLPGRVPGRVVALPGAVVRCAGALPAWRCTGEAVPPLRYPGSER